ncbi:uncharacterized protein V1518DRAFT_416264 [Limtongia smithiae]|uniref:uncharacterized protein n=1 Tax=Limtongia smithiae TaxID=1125753 RepID=UPI0034CEAAA8
MISSHTVQDEGPVLTEEQLDHVLKVVYMIGLARLNRTRKNEWRLTSKDFSLGSAKVCGPDTCRMRVNRLTKSWNPAALDLMKQRLRGSRFDRAIAQEFARFADMPLPPAETPLALTDAVPPYIASFFRATRASIARTFAVPAQQSRVTKSVPKLHKALATPLLLSLPTPPLTSKTSSPHDKFAKSLDVSRCVYACEIANKMSLLYILN